MHAVMIKECLLQVLKPIAITAQKLHVQSNFFFFEKARNGPFFSYMCTCVLATNLSFSSIVESIICYEEDNSCASPFRTFSSPTPPANDILTCNNLYVRKHTYTCTRVHCVHVHVHVHAHVHVHTCITVDWDIFASKIFHFSHSLNFITRLEALVIKIGIS